MDVVMCAIGKERALYGLWKESGDRTQARDIPTLSRQYYEKAGRKAGTVLPFYVLSRGYSPQTGAFSLFIGGEEAHGGLEAATLPKGLYACVEVKPLLGFLWGLSIGRAKRHFYTKWLPGSSYAAVNLEFERHDGQSAGKHPRIVLWFAVKSKMRLAA